MTRPTVGLLHPGAMGSSLGAAARATGAEVLWASAGRSAESRNRAANAGLTDVGTLQDLIAASAVLVSVCPPHAALDVAGSVAELGYRGIYTDVNAIAPTTARAVATIAEGGGARYVDGGVVGPPARSSGTTRLYLAGASAPAVAALFAGSLLGVVIMDAPPGAASALKMAYAAWTKGSTALLVAVRALAAAEGIEGELLAEWALSQPDLEERSAGAATRAPAKAWRFTGEMREIAASFAAAGLPAGFHHAAEAVYERLSPFRGRDASLDELLAALREAEPGA